MKKALFSILISILFFTPLTALEVDVDEISKSGKVNFINYEGRGGKSESISQIKSIGYQMGYKVAKGAENERFRYHMKYSFIRISSEADEPEKFSADIFYIDKDSSVDHIKNVRRILSAYLESVYKYSEKEADALALYLSYYNAVYRGDIDYFTSKYSKNVMTHITKNNAGISTKYTEWPGKTAMLIPLTRESKKGELDRIDPFAISDEKTSKEVKKDKTNGEDRKELTEIKKKEIKKDKEKIEKDKKKIEEDKKVISDKKKETDGSRKVIEEKKKEIKEEKEVTKKITDPEEKKKKEEEIKKKEEDVKKEVKEETTGKKDETKKDETGKDETKKDDKKQPSEDKLVKKEDELKKKEDELNKREDALKSGKTDQNVFGLKIYYLEVKEYLEGGHYNNALYMINAATKKIDFKSPVNNICGRRYDVFSGGIVVIAHNGNHVSGHKLTLIDRDKLTVKITGEDNIFWRSFIEIRDNSIYAIVKDNDNFYLGRFDQNLKLVAKSKDRIHENTFITFYDDFIYINRHDKSIIVLKKEDLSTEGEIKP